MRDEVTAVAEQERRFLIRHRDWTDGATLELNDWGFFLEEYEPQGFEVVANPPTAYWGGPSQDPSAVLPEPEPEPETKEDGRKAKGKPAPELVSHPGP